MDVIDSANYYYAVTAADDSFNVSPPSGMVRAFALVRQVLVTFDATLPPTTPPIGDPTGDIYMAGRWNNLNPFGTLMQRTGDFFATRTLPLCEYDEQWYKYTRGGWWYVEKGPNCEEIDNRTVTIVYGTDGTMIVEDTVDNWRNTGACGP